MKNNDISLTIRIPENLHKQLSELAKSLGVTKVTLLRFAIHLFLSDKPTKLTFNTVSADKKHRFVFNINQMTYDLLSSARKEYQQSINNVVTEITVLALKHYSRYL